MRDPSRIVLVLVAALAAPPAAASAQWVDQQPLAHALSTQVRDCRRLETLRIPLRSTGGDIVTLHAAGRAVAERDGAFAEHGLDAATPLQNDIRAQLKAYLACETPFMKASQAMLNATADITEADPRTEMIAVFQYGWSNGGDTLVARPGIATPADFSGATLAAQAHGPQLGYLARVLADAEATVEAAGGDWTPPTMRWTERLLGLDAETPGGAFLRDEDIDAAVVSRTDADILTAGAVGTGAEGSVKGAHVLLSTKSASRVIADALVVRRDYLAAHPAQVKSLVEALFAAEETLREDVIKQLVDWSAVAAALLGDRGAETEAEALWSDYETVGLKGNIDWAGGTHPRSFQAVNNDVQSYLVAAGLLREAHGLAVADWDYAAEFGENIFDQRMAQLPGFDDDRAAGAVDRLRAAGDVADRTLFTLDIRFRPN
ncbi:type 2 periplasmic-binding domain-containing protein [Thiohalocapsa halophila]